VAHRPDCPHCHARESVVAPSRIWWLAHAGAWVYAFGSVLGASLTGPLIVGLLPPLFVGGLCLVAATYERAADAPTCTNCGRTVPVLRATRTMGTYEIAHRHA